MDGEIITNELIENELRQLSDCPQEDRLIVWMQMEEFAENVCSKTEQNMLRLLCGTDLLLKKAALICLEEQMEKLSPETFSQVFLARNKMSRKF
jgi:hypothetical protein